MGVEEDILTAITGGFLCVMGAALWVWRRRSLLPLLEVLCLRWEQDCGCGEEDPYYHY